MLTANDGLVLNANVIINNSDSLCSKLEYYQILLLQVQRSFFLKSLKEWTAVNLEVKEGLVLNVNVIIKNLESLCNKLECPQILLIQVLENLLKMLIVQHN